MTETQRKHDHERSDFGARTPIIIALGMLVLVAVSIAGVVLAMNTVWAPAPPAAKLFETAEPPTPKPALQTDPQKDFAKLQRHWQQQLRSYGWVDREAGLVRVPIDVAMQRIAKQGLPGRDQPAGPVRSSAKKAQKPENTRPAP